MKGMLAWLSVLVVTIALVYQPGAYARSTLAKHSITFEGSASGGVLTLVELIRRNARHVTIRTKRGESAESVAQRLASAINESDPFEWWARMREKPLDTGIYAEEGSLEGLPGESGSFALAGTEKGLGIPRPPLSLSCSYDPKKDQVILHWANPPGPYDGVGFRSNGLGGRLQPGTTTSYVFDTKGRDISNMYFSVVGFRGDTPSSVAAIRLSNNAQDELFGYPFSNGIAPNWTGWLEGGNSKDVDWEEGTREELVAKAGKYPQNPLKGPWDKPFFQVIKVRSPGVKAGVWRKFLGLTPGHTYRVSALLNTLEMDSAQGERSFSLHAAYNEPEGTDLTVEQLSGIAQLPDGSKGPTAGQVACYTHGVTTKGKWEECSTDRSRLAPEQAISDIKLPPGVDTITVWVRHNASESTGVGILWVNLEDLSMQPDEPKK